MDDLVPVLFHLNKDPARDPVGYANKLYHPKVAGTVLQKNCPHPHNPNQKNPKLSIENGMVQHIRYFETKGPINNFGSYRGIF